MQKDKEIKQKILTIIDELNSRLIERDQLIRLIVLAIFSKSHMFLIGERGVAKSLTVRLIGKLIDKAKYWELQVGVDTEAKQLFGEKRVAENGTVYYNAVNTILDSHIPFLDEMFKAKNEMLNMLLQVMVDRYYTTGDGRMIKVPLISLFGASNEYPTGELAEPYLDRLLFWYQVDRIRDFDNRKKYFSFGFNQNPIEKPLITIEDIDNVYKEAINNVEIPEYVLDMIIDIINDLLNQGVKTSDRKYLDILKAMKVSAYLNGRDNVDYSEIFLLLFTAWHNDVERRKVNDVVYYKMFFNRANIENKIEDMKKEVEKVETYLNGNLYDFVNHNIDFIGENSTVEFEKYLNNVAYCYNMYFNLYKANNEIIKKINFIENIENLAKNNIFLNNIQNNTITEKMLKDISYFESKLKSEADMLYKWINNNKNMNFYNKGKNKI